MADGKRLCDNDARPPVIRHVGRKLLFRVRQSSSPSSPLRTSFDVFALRSAFRVSFRAIRLHCRDSCSHVVPRTTRQLSSVNNNNAVRPVRNVQAQGIRRRRRHDQGTYIGHTNGPPLPLLTANSAGKRILDIDNRSPETRNTATISLIFSLPVRFHSVVFLSLFSLTQSVGVYNCSIATHTHTHTSCECITRCCGVI